MVIPWINLVLSASSRLIELCQCVCGCFEVYYFISFMYVEYCNSYAWLSETPYPNHLLLCDHRLVFCECGGWAPTPSDWEDWSPWLSTLNSVIQVGCTDWLLLIFVASCCRPKLEIFLGFVIFGGAFVVILIVIVDYAGCYCIICNRVGCPPWLSLIFKFHWLWSMLCLLWCLYMLLSIIENSLLRKIIL